jgi:hypothetical protein
MNGIVRKLSRISASNHANQNAHPLSFNRLRPPPRARKKIAIERKNTNTTLAARRCFVHIVYIPRIANETTRGVRQHFHSASTPQCFNAAAANVSTCPSAGAAPPRRLFVLEKPKMSMQANFAPGLTEAWRSKKYCELMPEDIDAEWMDLMVKRLFRELDKQLNAIENGKAPAEPAQKAQVARTLASLERSLGRLTRIEADRAARREHKVAGSNDDKRAILESRLDRLAGSADKAGVPDESK